MCPEPGAVLRGEMGHCRPGTILLCFSPDLPLEGKKGSAMNFHFGSLCPQQAARHQSSIMSQKMFLAPNM